MTLVRTLAIATAVIASSVASPLPAQQSTAQDPLDRVPKIVAVINGQTMSREQLAGECLKRYGTIVLDNLLNKQLILQACKAKGVEITQQDVNEEIARVAAKVGLNVKMFLQTLEEERDITPEQYASEITWPMLALRALAADEIQVTSEDVDKILRSEYGPKVQVRMIAVSSKLKADQLHAAATAAPATFRRLAKEHSEDAASAAVDGLLPPVRQNADDTLARVAFQLKPNQISPVFQVGEMHFLLQCVRHLEARYPNAEMLAATRERVEERIRDQKLGQAADGIFQSLHKNSQVVAVLGRKDMEAKYPGVAGFINNAPVPTSMLAAECISRHGKEILRGEISRMLLTNALKKQGKQVTQQDLDSEVAKAAENEGYLQANGTADIEAWLKYVMQQEGATLELYYADAVWPSVALRKLVEDSVKLTEEDMQKGFENNFGPRAEVLAVILSNQRTAEEVFKKAREGRTEQAFGELAAAYSVEPMSRSNYGKIPAIRRHSGNPTLEKIAFALAPGEISGVLAFGDQYAVLYKQNESDPIVTEMEAVREELTKEIFEKKLRVAMSKYMSEMLKTAQIDNFLEGSSQSGKVVPASGTQAKGQVRPAVQR